MPSPSAEIDPLASEEVPADLAEAGVYPTAKDGFEHGLVALASGAAYWLMATEGGDRYRLMVEAERLADVQEQLAKFDRESAGWPPAPVVDGAARRELELFTPLLWGLAVCGAFQAQGEWRGLTDAGAVDARAMFERGEVWRAATALFLHADAGHLVSNLVSGIFAFAAVVTTLGRARGWALIAGAAVLGNVAAAAANFGNEYRSLGASTAIFAALGVLTGRAVRVSRVQRWRAVFAPLATGLTVLGLYGAGGVDVDVLAHATGFACGAALGFFGGVEKAKA